MIGDGTAFTRLRHGDKIRPGRSPEMYRVREIISDTEAVLAEDKGEVSPLSEAQYQGEGNWVSYDILESIDQTAMFHHVHSALASGQCLGIFPEGGSHDRTDLLPLKVHPHIYSVVFSVLQPFNVWSSAGGSGGHCSWYPGKA